jgi:hypothetical protein
LTKPIPGSEPSGSIEYWPSALDGKAVLIDLQEFGTQAPETEAYQGVVHEGRSSTSGLLFDVVPCVSAPVEELEFGSLTRPETDQEDAG